MALTERKFLFCDFFFLSQIVNLLQTLACQCFSDNKGGFIEHYILL